MSESKLVESRRHQLIPSSIDILSSLSKQRKLAAIFNAAARRGAHPVSSVSLKIPSCIVENVAKARASVVISRCITVSHALRKLRNAKPPSSLVSLPLRDISKSEPRSARVAALLRRRQAVAIILHVSLQHCFYVMSLC